MKIFQPVSIWQENKQNRNEIEKNEIENKQVRHCGNHPVIFIP